MREMFRNCSSLEVLDGTNFDTSAVKDFSRTFEYCYKLIFLDLSSFDTSSVTNMAKMFLDSMNLNLLILSKQFIMQTNYDQFLLMNAPKLLKKKQESQKK